MTATTTTSRPDGLLADRHLEVVQLVDVGRLQSEPVVLRPGSLVAVTGMGPRDSNETSKTTWLAATTLLTGDHGWRLSRGQSGPYAARLLFNPPDDPGAATRAETGWVLGVFGRAGHDRLTVVLRIQRDAPYLRFRIADGTHLVPGDDHTERIRAAPALWDTLPGATTLGPEQYLDRVLGGVPRSTGYVSDRGGLPQRRVGLLTTDLHHLTPREIGEELVELAGLRDRLVRERDQRRTVAQLRDDVERNERDLRRAEEQAQGELEALAQRRRANELTELAVSLRDAQVAAQVRERLHRRRELAAAWQRTATSSEAERLQAQIEVSRTSVAELQDTTELTARVDAARGELDAHTRVRAEREDRVRKLDVALGVVEQQLDDPALAAADRASGRSQDEVEQELADASAALATATSELHAAREREQAADRRLQDVRAGRTTDAATAVAAAGVDAVVVGDAVELADAGRARWEPVLLRWRDAVAVPRAALDTALAACRELPGTVLVPFDPPPTDAAGADAAGAEASLPDGVAAAPAVLRPFLAALPDATTGTTDDGVAHVTTTSPEHVLVAGHEHPQVGARARSEAAERLAAEARTRRETAEEHEAAARRLSAGLDDELTAARAQQQRERLRGQRGEVGRELAAARTELAAVVEEHDAADRAHRDLRDRLQQRDQRLAEARQLLAAEEELYAEKVDRVLREREQEHERLGLPWWLGRLRAVVDDDAVPGDLPDLATAAEGDDAPVHDRAEQVLAERIGDGARSVTTQNLDRRTNEALAEARTALGIEVRTAADGSVEVDAPNNVLREVRDAARDRARAVGSGRADAMLDSFDHLARALLDWLAPQLERDEVRAEQLERLLGERRDALAAAQEAHAQQAHAAQALQSSIHDLVEGTLQQVATAFAGEVAEDGLVGELRVDAVLPALDDVTAELRWDVTPRWARRTGADAVDYRRSANYAQMKVRAIQLVLAALRADGPGGRLLVLDELGAGLGADNRERVLAALRSVAERAGVTVLATVQDDLLSAAAPHVGEVLFFRYRDTSEDLNQPTRMLVQGPDERLVELRDALEAGRAFGFDHTSPVVPDQLAFDGADNGTLPDDDDSDEAGGGAHAMRDDHDAATAGTPGSRPSRPEDRP